MPGQPVFDGPKFAQTLRNHMDSKGLLVKDVVERSGLSRGSVQMLRRGTPASKDRKRGQINVNPRIDTLVLLADAIDQRLSFVLSWAGIDNDGDRFTAAERRLLAELLGGEPADVDALLRARIQSTTKET